MSSLLTFPELILLGYELCGEYSLYTSREKVERLSTLSENPTPAETQGFYKRPHLSTQSKLQAYLNKTKGFAGSKAAKRALQYIVAGSESPLETELSMRLSLPNQLGGHGLPLPEMNLAIILSPEARHVYPHATCRPDLCWPDARLCIEYDSNDHHTGAERIASDAARSAALAIMGYEVVTVTCRQRNDTKAFDGIARYVAKKLGKRIRPRSRDFKRIQAELSKMLRSGT